MRTSIEFEIERVVDDESEMVTVTVAGVFEHYSSYNRNESGVHLSKWDVINPPGLTLTKPQIDYAIDQLYRSIGR